MNIAYYGLEWSIQEFTGGDASVVEDHEDRLREIEELHNELRGEHNAIIDKLVRVGELISQEKAGIPLGQWGDWVRVNVPFSEEVAEDYLRFYENRELLRSIIDDEKAVLREKLTRLL